MTNLRADIARCLGQLPGPKETVQRCSKRDTCARYLQRYYGGEATPRTDRACHDESYSYYIEEPQQ